MTTWRSADAAVREAEALAESHPRRQGGCHDDKWCARLGWCFAAYLLRPQCLDKTAVCPTCGEVYFKSQGHKCPGPPKR